MMSQRNTKQIAISKLTLKNQWRISKELDKYNEETKLQE